MRPTLSMLTLSAVLLAMPTATFATTSAPPTTTCLPSAHVSAAMIGTAPVKRADVSPDLPWELIGRQMTSY